MATPTLSLPLRGGGWSFLGFLLIAALPAWPLHAEVSVPPLKTRVTDLTGTLKADQREALEAKLASFENRKGSQVAVLMVPTTQPEAIEQYSIRVAEQWKLGRKGVDDGILLLIAKNDRKMRLEVGRGLEGAIPDAIAKRIVSDVIAPRFKEEDFYGGIIAGVDRILRTIEGEPLPPPKVRQASDPGADVGEAAQQKARDLRDAGTPFRLDVGVIKFVIFLFFVFSVAIIALIFLPDSGRKPTGLDSGSAYGVGSLHGGKGPRSRSREATSHGITSRDDTSSRAKFGGIAGTCAGIVEWYVSGNGALSAILGLVVFLVITIGASRFIVEGIAGASVVILGPILGANAEASTVVGLIVFFVIMIYRRARGWGNGESWAGGGGGSSDGGGFFSGGGGDFGGGGASGDWGD